MLEVLEIMNPPNLHKLVFYVEAGYDFTRFLRDYPLQSGLERILETRRKMFEDLEEVLLTCHYYPGGSISDFRLRIAKLFDPEGRRGWKEKEIPRVEYISETSDY